MDAASLKADYRSALDEVGELICIRRYSGTGEARTKRDYPVQARVTGYEPKELVGNVVQGDRKLIFMAEDVEASGLTLPLRKGDKVVVRDKEINIEGVDDNTRRVGGELVAYELQARG